MSRWWWNEIKIVFVFKYNNEGCHVYHVFFRLNKIRALCDLKVTNKMIVTKLSSAYTKINYLRWIICFIKNEAINIPIIPRSIILPLFFVYGDDKLPVKAIKVSFISLIKVFFFFAHLIFYYTQVFQSCTTLFGNYL